MGKLDGRVVIVTGASRGIGESIAKMFAAEGGKVVCAARTLREGDHQLAGSLETTVEAIRDAGGEATAVAANISEPDQCEALVEATHQTYGPVDVLVNNAALLFAIPTKDYPVNRWLRTWSVNVHGPFILSQLVLKDMIPRGSGNIVNISSGAATGRAGAHIPEPPVAAPPTALRRLPWSVSPRALPRRSTSTAYPLPRSPRPSSCQPWDPCSPSRGRR